MADANIDGQRQSDLAKLPLYSGDAKDQFTAEQWVERISRSRTASNWTAPQTMAFVFNALRGHALKWFDSLKRSGIDRDNWDTFQTAFLKAFSTTRTPRTATVNLADLHQGQSETVVAFYPRVIKAVDDLEALVRGNFTLPDPVWPQEFLAVANFMAIGVDIRAAAAQALVSHGATAAFNHMALNLFISNLRPSLRDELLKTTPATLYEAFEAASQLEGIQEPSRKPTLSTAAINSDSAPPTTAPAVAADPGPDDDSLDKEIDALNFKLKNLRNRRQQTRPSSSSNGNNRNNGNNRSNNRGSGNRASQNRTVDKTNWICRYCTKKGHGQEECFSRRRDNAGLVGPDGAPYRNNNRPTATQAGINQVDQSYNPFLYATAPPMYNGAPAASYYEDFH